MSPVTSSGVSQNWIALNKDCFLYVLQFLDLKSVIAISLTCKSGNMLVKVNEVFIRFSEELNFFYYKNTQEFKKNAYQLFVKHFSLLSRNLSKIVKDVADVQEKFEKIKELQSFDSSNPTMYQFIEDLLPDPFTYDKLLNQSEPIFLSKSTYLENKDAIKACLYLGAFRYWNNPLWLTCYHGDVEFLGEILEYDFQMKEDEFANFSVALCFAAANHQVRTIWCIKKILQDNEVQFGGKNIIDYYISNKCYRIAAVLLFSNAKVFQGSWEKYWDFYKKITQICLNLVK